MLTPARILRADADSLERDPPELSARDQEQYERILVVAVGIMARHNSYRMTIPSLARELGIGAGTLRRHFPDAEVLLATLLLRHLAKIARTIGEVPHDAADRPEKMRAAYLAYTRINLGEFTDAHLLLVRDRYFLPNDLRPNIEATHRDLGDILAPGYGAMVLPLLDALAFDAPGVESTLAAIGAKDRIKAIPPVAPYDPPAMLPSIHEHAGGHTIH